MGKDMILSQFDDIEQKVEFLIKLCSSLRDDNSKHKNRINELEMAIEKKSETERLDDEQREIIKGRVDSLLDRLKNFTEITS